MLHLHRAERADVLVGALGDVLATPLADPLETEVVSVPTRGVERWLTQRLAHRLGTSGAPGAGDGVCGNVEFPFPGRLVGDAMAAACGLERDADPWLPERAVWPLLGVLDDHLHEPWLGLVAGHLAGQERSRRFTTARHVADLFDRYAVHRPEMVRGWAAGESHADAPWQAELWRRLRDRIGTESPAERLAGACAALAADRDLVELPARVSIFGLTRLPASYLDVLRALAVERDVHLFLLHPSPVLWEAVAARAGGLEVRRRADDPTGPLATHPLLRSWGRDAREMQLVLTAGAGAGAVVADHHHPLTPDASGRAERPMRSTNAPRTDGGTQLARLQAAVRDDGVPEPLGAPDGTLQVHAAHGRARQVEIVRDLVLHLLADDPTLEPRDVIVMCPDIEAFAPLIHATFGAGEGLDDDDLDGAAPDAGPNLRVRLADRSLRQTNPVLAAVSVLLELADSRVSASQVLDFAGRDPVRRRFRFDDDDLSRLKEWVAETAVRWGLDGEHRQPFQLANVDQNTWRAGVDRVLVGVTMADEDQRLVDGVLPLDDVDSGSIDLAGRFAELVDRLHRAVHGLQGPHTVAGWAEALTDAAYALLAVSDRDAWQRGQLHRILDEIATESSDAPAGAELMLSELRALLADRLRGQPTRANFRTGHLTFCTLVPMRSVPHRVVVLLGLDDAAFPRKGERDGDDLVAADPFVGDVDGRSEDRQLLLDALLAATERLVITYSGHDERTNAELPPAVPVGELLDVVGHDLVVHHPLQPFDPRNFEPGRLGRGGPWSFDAVTLTGAQALLGPRAPAPPFLSGPLAPAAREEIIELDALVKFAQHPVRAFLRQRLGISVGDFEDDVLDAIPVELDGLGRWGIGERVLGARLAGASAEACRAAELARGELPPHGLAGGVYEDVAVTVERLVGEVTRLVGPPGEVDSVEVGARLDDGRLVVGTVAGIVGSVARTVTFSKLAAKHRAPAWVRFLALGAARPAERFEVVTIGRGIGRRVVVSRFAPVSAEVAEIEAFSRRQLHAFVDLYDRGMCEPLPVACATSAAYAEAVRRRRDPRSAMTKVWESGKFPGEDRDPEHVLVHGGSLGLDELLAAVPCDGEDGDGWDATETTRFGRYARRFWDALLDAERLEER
jgi:exodeoxyribonuclease V gamma subunit